MKSRVSKIICLGLVLTLFSSLAGSISFADEFAWNDLDGGWTFTKNPDVFLLPIQDNDDQWEGVDSGPKLLRAPIGSGDWTIDTRISDNNNSEPVGHNSHVGLVVYKDMDNWILFGQEYNSRMTANGVIGGRGFQIGNNSSGVYRYMRIHKVGSTYSFSYSNDGQSWSSLPSYNDTNGALNGAQYGIMGKSWEPYQSANNGINTPSYWVQFDYFNEAVG